MSNTISLEDALQKLLVYYGEHYEIRHNFAVGGQEVRVLAEFHLLEEKSIFGIKAPGMKARSSEASEYVLFLLEDSFTEESMERFVQLLEAAEQDLLNLHKEHGYSFFSLVLLTRAVDKAAAAKLKKYSKRSTYSSGWGMNRVAVIELDSLTAFCNRDGKELGALVLNQLKK